MGCFFSYFQKGEKKFYLRAVIKRHYPEDSQYFPSSPPFAHVNVDPAGKVSRENSKYKS